MRVKVVKPQTRDEIVLWAIANKVSEVNLTLSKGAYVETRRVKAIFSNYNKVAKMVATSYTPVP